MWQCFLCSCVFVSCKVVPVCCALGRMMKIAIMAAAVDPQGILYRSLIEAAGIKLGSLGFADVARTSPLRPLCLLSGTLDMLC